MTRHLHKIPGLLAAVLVSILALSGAILSVMPALERAGTASLPSTPVNVATLAANIQTTFPGVEQIKRKPSGKIVVYYFNQDIPGAAIVDPATGKKIADFAPSGFEQWMTTLHRSLFLDDAGRAVAGFGAAAMLILSLSGLTLVAKRQGGWRKLFAKARGTGLQRLHVAVGRIVAGAFLLTAATALYMSLTTFSVIPDGLSARPDFPRQVNGGTPAAPGNLAALKTVTLSDFRELTFPYAGDASDAFALTTAAGSGYIDQATGEMLSWLPNSRARQVYEFVFMLHTGQGLWQLALVLGLASVSIPLMAMSGGILWWRNRKASPRITGNYPAQKADTIILVGSEGGSTWGFAKTLHDGLAAQGFKVHTGPMNGLAVGYRQAERMFILTSTYGDGAAPASARSFLKRLDNHTALVDCPVSVLGFGDRQFPQFCKFADDVAEALGQKNWPTLIATAQIDRQSVQEFSRWGRAVGAALGIDLDLVHLPVRQPSRKLALVSRVDYGAEVQAPTTIFRFAPSGATGLWGRLFGRGLPRFKAGDLVGILPPGSDLPRYYSLASSRTDGVLEICVRKHPGGLCSGLLHGLQVGDTIDAFIKPNPDFRPLKSKAPVILVGAGTGIGPLAGFIRGNKTRKPMHLYFGGRDPSSDFLYRDEIRHWLRDNRLASMQAAFSRVGQRSYVQGRLLADADLIRSLIADGAQIMVCGGREMAQGVAESLDAILEPLNLQPAQLRAAGRYVEDVY